MQFNRTSIRVNAVMGVLATQLLWAGHLGNSDIIIRWKFNA